MNIIVFVTLLILIIILIVWYLLRRKWAIRQVKCTSEEEKLTIINAVLKPLGFAFDSYQDIVVSQKNPWQRELGYMNLYDLKAPFFNMVFDAEPICFEYNYKEYRIEFWKGQYGITTGAEVGVYVKDECSQKPNFFYRAATDDECLDISFILTKKCNLFSLCNRSWWLAGFDVGMFSRPRNLMMSVCINFPNENMQTAFLKSLINAGYSKSNVYVYENTICFEYCHPHNYKLNKRHRIIKCIAQVFNYINCCIFNFFTRPFNSTLDKFTYLRFMFPRIYHLIIGLSLPRKKKKHYHKRVKN